MKDIINIRWYIYIISIKIFTVVEKPVPPPKNIPEELMPQNLVELETSCGEAAAKAIAAYRKAACALHEYNQDVIKVVESAGTTISGAVWQRWSSSRLRNRFMLRFCVSIVQSDLSPVAG